MPDDVKRPVITRVKTEMEDGEPIYQLTWGDDTMYLTRDALFALAEDIFEIRALREVLGA